MTKDFWVEVWRNWSPSEAADLWNRVREACAEVDGADGDDVGRSKELKMFRIRNMFIRGSFIN